ncbi:MAG TPA: PAS domain S-box protein [Verrucomicrobiae bacterium]|nr:PAS domain S-box protein [Verrucomicrobiae bacterium]
MPVLVLDPDLKILSWNDAAKRLYGYDESEAVGRAGHTLLQTKFPESLDNIRAALRKKNYWKGELFEKHRDGSEIVTRSFWASHQNAAGEFPAILEINIDITDCKRTERALKESEQKLRTVFDNSNDSILLHKADGEILEANQTFLKWSGISSEKIGGVKVQEFFDPESPTDFALEVWKKTLAGEPQFFAWKGRRPCDGLEVDLEIFLQRIQLKGEPVILATARDVSPRKKAEAALEQTREILRRHADELEIRVRERTAKLEEAVQELESFSYSVAHDLRAPLRSMRGFGTLLQLEFGESIGEDAKDLIRRINSSAERMDRLITDVLNYSKIVRQEMKMDRVDMDKLLHEIVDTYPVLQSSEATIHFENPLPCVRGNMAALTQCFSNLLGNAVKFVAPGVRPDVWLWSQSAGEHVRIFVRDNGVGIPEHGAKRIFEIFQRLHSESEYEGTGIGLAIVRKSVERMGGEVGLESAPGKGSTFWVELDAWKNEMANP